MGNKEFGNDRGTERKEEKNEKVIVLDLDGEEAIGEVVFSRKADYKKPGFLQKKVDNHNR